MARREKIFVLITRGNLGGAQIHLLGLLQALSVKYRLVLGCGEEDFLTRAAAQSGIEVKIFDRLVRPISPADDLAAYRQVRDYLRSAQPDLVHLHSSKAGVIGRLAARATGTPWLFTAHGWAFSEGAGFRQRSYGLLVEWLLSRLGGGIITVSDYDYHLARRYGVGRAQTMWTVKNGISELKVKAQPATGSLFRILNIGRMSRAKNQLCLIDALARVEGEFHATIIGDGRLRPQIESRITQLGLSDRVTLAGETDEVASQFASAHLFVLSSDYEGLPLSVLEAMSAGLPVVATDVGGVGEAVESGKTGYLVPRGDSVAMAARITRLLDDPALRLAMGNSGLERYREQFTLPPMVAGTESVYRQLLGD